MTPRTPTERFRAMAIRTFANDTTRDIFLGENTKAARRIPRRVWRSAQTKLLFLNSANKLSQVAQIPGLRLKPLKFDKPGYHEIRVNDQYRIVFHWIQRPTPEKDGEYYGDAYDVSIEDPRFHQP